MISKQNPGVAIAAPNGKFFPVSRPAAVVVEKNDPEEHVLRLEVVRVAA